MAALGELFIPSGVRGWHCFAGIDCVLNPGLESIQLGDHSSQFAFHIVLLVSEPHPLVNEIVFACGVPSNLTLSGAISIRP